MQYLHTLPLNAAARPSRKCGSAIFLDYRYNETANLMYLRNILNSLLFHSMLLRPLPRTSKARTNDPDNRIALPQREVLPHGRWTAHCRLWYGVVYENVRHANTDSARGKLFFCFKSWLRSTRRTSIWVSVYFAQWIYPCCTQSELPVDLQPQTLQRYIRNNKRDFRRLRYI